ncbi:hypothetical protein VB711_03950 [Cronbergia sp. UHCC 0137]|uniref:hypothetical protein n=1 Tax=Cronbergia sp. UHCC 0137 TaxID=3110239 RepID=UPI002B20DCF2|nr:hypothetical protein [Cronbergia sp. UHCC 0137]MEA5616998.1 hypothetical protein [Cronbergia sp. UHCC 0137]
MPSVSLWVPESDYDRDAVSCIAQKIVEYYKCENLNIKCVGKATYNDVARKPDGLQKAVNTYLKKDQLVIFLLDSDGIQSQAQRQKEPNSLINRIQEVVNSSGGRVKLIFMVQELEAWLLVDCLGICCYFTKNDKTRQENKWISFTRGIQLGQTDLIAEAESGGKGAKEYLVKISKEILIKKNPNLKDKHENLKKLKYDENESHEIAKFIEISHQTITRNQSLAEFAKTLKEVGIAHPTINLEDDKGTGIF